MYGTSALRETEPEQYPMEWETFAPGDIDGIDTDQTIDELIAEFNSEMMAD